MKTLLTVALVLLLIVLPVSGMTISNSGTPVYSDTPLDPVRDGGSLASAPASAPVSVTSNTAPRDLDSFVFTAPVATPIPVLTAKPSPAPAVKSAPVLTVKPTQEVIQIRLPMPYMSGQRHTSRYFYLN